MTIIKMINMKMTWLIVFSYNICNKQQLPIKFFSWKRLRLQIIVFIYLNKSVILSAQELSFHIIVLPKRFGQEIYYMHTLYQHVIIATGEYKHGK